MRQKKNYFTTNSLLATVCTSTEFRMANYMECNVVAFRRHFKCLFETIVFGSLHINQALKSSDVKFADQKPKTKTQILSHTHTHKHQGKRNGDHEESSNNAIRIYGCIVFEQSQVLYTHRNEQSCNRWEIFISVKNQSNPHIIFKTISARTTVLVRVSNHEWHSFTDG